MRANRIVTGSVLMVVAFVFAALTTTFAQAEKTPSQTYMEYHAALQKAKKIEDILPFMTAARRKEAASMPAEMKSGMIGMIQELGIQPGFKVVKEDKTATGATLMLEGVDKSKSKTSVTVTMVREAGAWKIEKEDQKTGK